MGFTVRLSLNMPVVKSHVNTVSSGMERFRA